MTTSTNIALGHKLVNLNLKLQALQQAITKGQPITRQQVDLLLRDLSDTFDVLLNTP